MASSQLVVIDGYSLLFRAFHGTRFLSTSDGRPTNALFGFVSMLFQILQTDRPDYLVVALDAPGETFRHVEYAEYKGTRRETPAELIVQLQESRELIDAFAIPALEVPGYEADDVVGTLARLAEERGLGTTIVTGDLDALQLVTDRVSVMVTVRGVSEVMTYDPSRVKARYGFEPALVPDFKALVGDPSDNIPGVPGIGEKSASLLLQRFGPVENLLEHLADVEEKYRKKIEPYVEQIPRSKSLATIRRDAPVSLPDAPYRISEATFEKAKAVLASYEFRTHTKRLGLVLGPYLRDGEGGPRAVAFETASRIEPKVVEPSADPARVHDWLGEAPFALWRGGAGPQPALLGDGLGAYLAKGDEAMRVPERLALELFAEAPSRAIVHGAKSLYRDLGRAGAPARFDSSLAGYVLQPGRGTYELPNLVQAYLDVASPSEPEAIAVALYRLEEAMTERLEQEGQLRVLRDVELPLTPILAEMEMNGIALDVKALEEFSRSLESVIEETAQRIYELAGERFLIASPKQLGAVLFEKMGLPGGKRTETGWATGAEILQTLDHPIAREILAYREYTKLKSTYADALPKLVGPDGRIHTSFNQTVAATGRLSSNDPNLQNIPVRTELGRQIRQAFVAAPGTVLVSFDYSQIELRLLAHLCEDEALVRSFRAHEDIHTATASQMFGVPDTEVTKEQRRLAKMLNYAVLYGVTEYGLAAQLGEGFGVADARKLIQRYNERFPSVKGYTQKVVEEARAKGFTTTLIGRRRYFPDIHSANRAQRQYAERQAMNAPIQGSAADMIKIAMIRVRPLLEGRSSRLLLQVHDELLFEMPPEDADLIGPIRKTMEEALPLSVPVEVDAKRGPNWSDMDPIPVSP